MQNSNKKDYGKLCTLIYDLDKPFAGMEEIQIYTQFVESKSDSILEPMCGSGRFYIPLLQGGYNIQGYDLSRDMLDACKNKCLQLNISPKIFQADITTYTSTEKFKYIFIPIGSISLLVLETEIANSFINIYNYLDNYGVFIFSYLGYETKYKECSEWTEVMRYPIGEELIVCKQKVKFNNQTSVLEINLLYELIHEEIIIENEYQYFPLRLFDDEYLKSLLKLNGFNYIEKIAEVNDGNRFNIIKCSK